MITGVFTKTIQEAFEEAITAAEEFRGATAPNPCVGAVALDRSGKILSIQAHQKAGTPHAEALLIRELKDRGLLSQAALLFVTLEPCSHHGRMPPCSEAIIRAYREVGAFQTVIYACKDQNPIVSGQGAENLRNAGIEVHCLEMEDPDSPVVARAQQLVAPFFHWLKTKRPWVTLKTAVRVGSLIPSMIPPHGQKTFTSPESLKFAHQLRKRADAILTGSGTVLADHPLFTVRLVPDHPQHLLKSRWLVVLDRRKRTPASWIAQAQANGFQVQICQDFEQSLDFLGSQGCLEVLVEAGPTVSELILKSGLWNEHIQILNHDGDSGQPDRIEITYAQFSKNEV